MRPQSLAGSRLYTKNVGSSLFQDAFSCCKVTYEDGLRHEIQKKAVKNGCRQLQMGTQINFFVTCDLTVLLAGLYILYITDSSTPSDAEAVHAEKGKNTLY